MLWLLDDGSQTVSIYDVETARLVRAFEGAGRVYALELSADGAVVLMRRVQRAEIFERSPDRVSTLVAEVATGTTRSIGTTADVLALSPRGDRLAYATAGEASKTRSAVTVVDVASGELVARWELSTCSALDLAFSTDGARLADASSCAGIHVWDAKTGQLVFERAAGPSPPNCVAFDPDGNVWSTGERGQLVGWDARGAALPVFPPPAGLDPRFVAFGPDSAAALGYDGNLAVWDRASRKPLEPIRANAQSLVFSPDGTRLFGCVVSSACAVWNVATGTLSDFLFQGEVPSPWLVPGLSVARHAAWKAAYEAARARDPRVDWDDVLPIGDTASFAILEGEEVEIVGARPQPARSFDFGDVFHAAVSADGRWISARGKLGNLGLFDVASLTRSRDLAPGGQFFGASTWSPSTDTVALWSPNGNSIGFASASDERRGGVLALNADILDLSFSADGARVAVGMTDGSVRIVDVATVSETMRLEHPTVASRREVFAVAFSPDGRSVASANGEGTLVLWNVERAETNEAR